MEAVRAADRDRYLSTLYAPGDRRPALFSLYAFNAEICAIRDRIRLGRKALSAHWDSGAGLWTVECEDAEGGRERLAGRFLFFGSGYYDYDAPHDPAIPGLLTLSERLTAHRQAVLTPWS